jgi:hypothetical protein
MSCRLGIACGATILLAAACGGGSATTPTPTALHAEVGDPGGDALADPSVTVSPDLVHATVDVSAGNIAFAIQFAPGTLDRSTSRLTIQLDTDQNPSTGIRTATGVGVEYAVDMWAPANQASILKAVPTAGCTAAAADPCYLQMGAAPLSVSADGMAVTIPLSLIGSADGRLSFRVLAYASKPGGVVPTVTDDLLPDMALAPGHVP